MKFILSWPKGHHKTEVLLAAYGKAIDRIAMLKCGVSDLRAFFDSGLRWLRHYGFSALDMPTLHGGFRGEPSGY